jgi:DtxR family transcriptional regulator, Mn-dependent transcriptional regulator
MPEKLSSKEPSSEKVAVGKAAMQNPAMTEKTISSATEDYLKAIFELGENNVKTQDVADALGVSAASVTGMLKKLSDLNLVRYEKYYGVSLSEAGRNIALETLRHHRLIETYLIQALGYAWHEVHEEAEKLEHHISEDFEKRIAAMLGNPTYDPHGDPIPALDGSMPESKGKPLPEFAAGQTLEITRITNQETDVLRYLAEHKLVPGETVTIVTMGPFGGPVTVQKNQKTLAISLELAQQIHGQLAAV